MQRGRWYSKRDVQSGLEERRPDVREEVSQLTGAAAASKLSIDAAQRKKWPNLMLRSR